MPATFRAPRGTRDILPAEHVTWARVEAAARDLASRYGYRDMEIPLFEQSAVFERGVGEVTDIVEKELFRVSPSRGEERERWALRPEATAGIVRAYVEHGLHTLPQPVRVSVYGPFFRYDRPQAGRYRQFYQWDVEAIGDAGPAVDAEILELGIRFYRACGLEGVFAKLNSIGDAACRPGYIAALKAFYERHRSRLPKAELDRLERNPLRLLDSKEPVLVELNREAPRTWDHLCDACAEHFAAVRVHLDALDVPYRLAPEIVRGLDYYTRTTFEYVKPGAEGQQDALGGGGRYDGLVELLGGRPTPAIGFALGVDRVVLAVQALAAEPGDDAGAVVSAGPLAVVVGSDPAATVERLRVATDLRAAGLAARADLSTRKLGKQLESAAREAAHFAVIVGEESADAGRAGAAGSTQLQVKDLKAGTQKSVASADLARELARAGKSHRHGGTQA
jgi:histidyl-tRNA synthetase